MSKGRERERVEGIPSRQGGKGMRRAASPARLARRRRAGVVVEHDVAAKSCVPGSWLDPGTQRAYL